MNERNREDHTRTIQGQSGPARVTHRIRPESQGKEKADEKG